MHELDRFAVMEVTGDEGLFIHTQVMLFLISYAARAHLARVLACVRVRVCARVCVCVCEAIITCTHVYRYQEAPHIPYLSAGARHGICRDVLVR